MPKITIEYEFIDNLKKLIAEVDRGSARMSDSFKQVGDRLDKTIEKNRTSVNDIFKGALASNIATKFFDGITSSASKAFSFIKSETMKWELSSQKLGSVITDRITTSRMMDQFDEIAQAVIPIEELTDSYIRLANNGIRASKRELTSFANFSKSQGKSVLSFTQAITNAMNGNTRSLKEFGVVMREVDGKMQVSFRGQKKTIDATKDAVKNYLVGLGEQQGIAGSIERAGEGVSGGSAKLTDALEKAGRNIGERFKGTFDYFLKGMTKIVENIASIAKVKESEKAAERNKELLPFVRSYMDLMKTGKVESAQSMLGQINKIDPNLMMNIDPTDIKAVGAAMQKYIDDQKKLVELERLYAERESKLRNNYAESQIREIERTLQMIEESPQMLRFAEMQGVAYNPSTRGREQREFLREWVNDFPTQIEGIRNLFENTGVFQQGGAGYNPELKTALERVLTETGGLAKNVDELDKLNKAITDLEEALGKNSTVIGDNTDNLNDPLKEEGLNLKAGSTVKELTVNQNFDEKSIFITTNNITETAINIREIILNELRKVAQNVPSTIKQ